MTIEELTLSALVVSLLGHLVQFGMFMIHCRRDKREVKRLENRQETLR